MRTFAILNNKGGVGKTTTAINLAVCLATTHQQRVLLVDADGQRNATRALLRPGKYDGLAAILTGFATCYDEVIEPTDIENLDMIPASSELWSIDLHSRNGGGAVYCTALRDVRDAIIEDDSYDVMVIDCPPTFLRILHCCHSGFQQHHYPGAARCVLRRGHGRSGGAD